MSGFGQQIQARRRELGLSRDVLAQRLAVTPSAVSNYENGISFPKEAVMLRLFDGLETDPNRLFTGCYRSAASGGEAQLVQRFRMLPPQGQAALLALLEAVGP